MKNIAVIGAGAMGNGIAHTFAQSGYKVQLVDVNQEALNKALQTISKNLDRLVAKGKIEDSTKAETLSNISTFTNLSEGVEYASLVIEAATENIDLKLKIFQQLDTACPEDTILATNTSSISITQIAAVTSRPQQVIGMHFMNPVPIMPLVEIIAGYNTSKEVLSFTKNLTEAIETLHSGVAGVQEIDTIMKLGMAHPMGPLELADFIGLDVCLSILEVMYDGFKKPKYAPNPLLVNMVHAGKYGIKSGEGFYNYENNRKAIVVASQFS